MSGYASYSYWLETCDDELEPRPALDGSVEVDVAILGAGFTGLWTAYYLLKREPSLKVAIIEKEIAGFGASGRNGGWCSPKLNIGVDSVARLYDERASRALQAAMYDTVPEIGRVCAEEGIDAEYDRCGALFIARGRHQLPEMESYAESFARYGFGRLQEVLDAAETERRIRVAGACGSILFKTFASIHPGKLVRGLARVVERLGATIHERTPVTDFVTGRAPALHTLRGDVRARVVVLAAEAYLSRLPRLRRRVLPVYSMIVLTEPLGDAVWEEIGWRNRELVCSFRLTVDYLTRTADGRILFGGRGAPYRFGSAIGDALDRHEETHAMLRAMAREWFPPIRDVRFTHCWGGPVGMPRDWMPSVRYDRPSGLAIACGYTGDGVALSNLAGRILSDLICGVSSPLTDLPVTGHRSPPWEPEPLRWLGVRYVQEALVRVDRRAERTGRPPSGRTIAERLAPH
ncbi:MAG: NAD(P)/FAD-dependent oxidoreductase [Acidobacteriota bacterium]